MTRNALLISTIVLLAPAALAADRHVPAQYSTIQAAINASSSGDEVIVSPGVYNEAINFGGRAITVRGSGGPDVTVIDATGLNASTVRFQTGEGPNSVLEGFTVTGGTGTVRGVHLVGGGIYCYATSPTIRDCVVTANVADSGAGMYNLASNAVIAGCEFTLNESLGGEGGGGMFNSLSSVTVRDCRFYGNSSSFVGGGMANTQCAPSISNCVFELNAAVFGGAIRNFSASPSIVNCTFGWNYGDLSLSTTGGALNNSYSSHATVTNCIMWSNFPNQVTETSDSPTTISYTNIQGGWDGAGSNDMSSDPMFEDGLRLPAESPCVDAGSNAAAADLQTDFDGNARIVNNAVDLGAFEAQTVTAPDCPGDLTGDDQVNAVDILVLFSSWGDEGGVADLNGDGTVDAADLIQMLAQWGACP